MLPICPAFERSRRRDRLFREDRSSAGFRKKLQPSPRPSHKNAGQWLSRYRSRSGWPPNWKHSDRGEAVRLASRSRRAERRYGCWRSSGLNRANSWKAPVSDEAVLSRQPIPDICLPGNIKAEHEQSGSADLQRTVTDKRAKRNVGSDPNQRGERRATAGANPIGVERQRCIATGVGQPKVAPRLRQIR
jgi:hypothetical protein